MEGRIQRIFLELALTATLALCLPASLQAQQVGEERPPDTQSDGDSTARSDTQSHNESNSVLDKIITPEMKRRRVREEKIDSEDIEVGIFYGIMSIEDFGSNRVSGLRFAYHVSEDFFFEANYGESTAEESSFEVLSGTAQLLTDEERELSYYNLTIGYNLLPGEVFIGEKWAFNSNFYLIAGAGNTDFAGDEVFTYTLGGGLRLFATDWVALHLDMRDHIFDLDIFGEEKTSNNLEAHIGLTFFF